MGPGGSGAVGRPQQRSFRREPQNIPTPLTWDLVPPLTLLPLLFPNFSSSNFTCKTFQAEILSYQKVFDSFYCFFLDQKQCLSLQPARSKAPCGAQPGATEPLLRAGEQRRRRGAGDATGERDRSHLAHLQAAAGRLSGHFFRNANHALPYHIKPLIANDAFRVGGERLPPAAARGSASGTVCGVGPFFEPRRRLPWRPRSAGMDISGWAQAVPVSVPPVSVPPCLSRRRHPQPQLPSAPLLLPREAAPRSESDGAPAQAHLWLLCRGPVAVLRRVGYILVMGCLKELCIPEDPNATHVEPLLARTP